MVPCVYGSNGQITHSLYSMLVCANRLKGGQADGRDCIEEGASMII